MVIERPTGHHLHCSLCDWRSESCTPDMPTDALMDQYVEHFDTTHRPRPVYVSDVWPCGICGEVHIVADAVTR